MTDYYVASTGSNTSPYDTWAKAATDPDSAFGLMAPGDRCFIDKDIAWTAAASKTFVIGTGGLGVGTFDPPAPSLVLCVDRTGDPEPPVAGDIQSKPASTTIEVTGGTITLQLVAYHPVIFQGLTFANNAGNGSIIIYGEYIEFRECRFEAESLIRVGNYADQGAVIWRDCDVKKTLASTAQMVELQGGHFVWDGGAYDSNSLSPPSFFFRQNSVTYQAADFRAYIRGVDFTDGVWTTSSLVHPDNANVGYAKATQYLFDRCKLNSDASVLAATIENPMTFVRLTGCPQPAGSAFADFREFTWAGETLLDVLHYRTNGATNGTNNFSYKMVSVAGCGYPLGLELRIELFINTLTQKNITIHFAQDATAGAELDDDEFHARLIGPNTSGQTIASEITHTGPGLLGTPSQLAASTEGWTDTLASWANDPPLRQKLEITGWTPTGKGQHVLEITLSKPSATVWVCPQVEVVDA